MDVELEKKEPPEYLYHGTSEKYHESIEQQGLIPKSRLYVHLSADIETAVKVGSRHGVPVVYRVSSGLMHQNGFVFREISHGKGIRRASSENAWEGVTLKTLIYCMPEYMDLARKLCVNYIAHHHEKADIISEQDQDDVEYAREMQYDEAIFIEDAETVIIHDIESGHTRRCPVSEVYYRN